MTCSERKVWFGLAFLFFFFPPFKSNLIFSLPHAPPGFWGGLFYHISFFFFNLLKMK